MVSANRQGGFSLLLALAAMALVASTVLLVSQHLQTRLHSFQLEERNVGLISLGDAAMAEALANLKSDPSFTGAPAHRFSDGVISSSVSPGSGSQPTITAHATRGGWQTTVVATIDLGPTGPQVIHWERSQGPMPRS